MSEFIKQLHKDLDREYKIKKNAKVFILDRLLKETDLNDTNCTLGTIYMIKNNSILQFYQYYTNENIDIRVNEQLDFYYKCMITIHNLHQNDISDFNNSSKLSELDEMISYDREKINDFIKALRDSDFKIYIKP